MVEEPVAIPEEVIRVLARILIPSLPRERLSKVAQALAEFLTEQRALEQLDLTEVDPAIAYDPRWE